MNPILEVPKPQLQLFEPKNVQNSILQTDLLRLRWLWGWLSKFVQRIYSFDTELFYQSEDVKDVTTAPTDSTLEVYPVNNLLHSLFRQVTLTLNGVQVSQHSNNYANKAILENFLNFSNESAALWNKVWRINVWVITEKKMCKTMPYFVFRTEAWHLNRINILIRDTSELIYIDFHPNLYIVSFLTVIEYGLEIYVHCPSGWTLCIYSYIFLKKLISFATVVA